MPLRRNRRQYEQLTDFDRGRIIGLREAGWSNRRIGRHLGQSDMVVARCWQQWITEGRVYRRGGSGRPRNTNDHEDRAIRRVATSAPTTSLASIQRHLPPSRHPVPSRETIRRRLTEVGLRSRRPLRRLPLTPHHRQCRLDFCRPRATWSVTDRDVSSSVMNPDSVSVMMTTAHVFGRRTGQRSDPAFIVERHTAISQDSHHQSSGAFLWGRNSAPKLFVVIGISNTQWPSSTPQVQSSNPEMGKVNSALHPLSRLINDYQTVTCRKHCGFRVILTGTSAHARKCPRSQKLRWTQYSSNQLQLFFNLSLTEVAEMSPTGWRYFGRVGVSCPDATKILAYKMNDAR
ncbi:HTH_Tnp_Tc3_2 domain-containing protein [Trichonephila clavipes]|nr:HTH_Tnp_Tc3_2 domain-containing protein [Trichonephila clavipes]